jgi:hypothetical protein
MSERIFVPDIAGGTCVCGKKKHTVEKEFMYDLTATTYCRKCGYSSMYCIICGYKYYTNYRSLKDKIKHLSEKHFISSFTPGIRYSGDKFYMAVTYENGPHFRMFNIPAYMSMLFVPEYDLMNLCDLWNETANDCNEEFIIDRHEYADTVVKEYILRQSYSCSICGGIYDTISEEIFSAHIKLCTLRSLRSLRSFA